MKNLRNFNPDIYSWNQTRWRLIVGFAAKLDLRLRRCEIERVMILTKSGIVVKKENYLVMYERERVCNSKFGLINVLIDNLAIVELGKCGLTSGTS